MFWKCLFSPKLYAVYREGTSQGFYQTQGLEKWSERIISSANTLINIGMYTSPLICLYIYRRGFYTMEELKSLSHVFGSVGTILLISFIIRAYYRVTNPKYMQFLRSLESVDPVTSGYMETIRKYDFEFYAWPVTFKMPATMGSSSLASPFNRSANEELSPYPRIALQLLAYIAVNTFALRLIYPGSMGLIQSLLWHHLLEGRLTLVENYNGERAKIITADGNAIDTMFVDKRNTSKGNTLVICCEGNSGFYEVGIMTIPVKAGYSALGWNHPGFASSTGLPYPSQEHNAIDAIMQYAIERLNFKPENIVMFGWSIGGYSASWAASRYPVKALILDATFDDLLPLAQNQMPSSWALLVKEVVRSHVDLNVAEMVRKYKGPVHLIRRSEDEIICLSPGRVSTNRGNYLAIDIIKHRYPNVASQYETELNKFANMLAEHRPVQGTTEAENTVIKLLKCYTSDFKSTHCAMLSEQMFDSIMKSVTSGQQMLLL